MSSLQKFDLPLTSLRRKRLRTKLRIRKRRLHQKMGCWSEKQVHQVLDFGWILDFCQIMFSSHM
jgi:hypothetical protein